MGLNKILVFVIAATYLNGYASVESTKGRIGIERNCFTNRIERIHKNSPAHKAGLQLKDKIISKEKIVGPTGGIAHVVVQRKTDTGIRVLEFDIERISFKDCPKEYIE